MKSGRDWIELATKLVVLAIVIYPLVPESRVRWFYTMRILQRLAAEIGAAAILAENQYHRAVGEI
jgi:hypothetical protein